MSLNIVVSLCNFVYMLNYNEAKDAFVIKGYSLNGLTMVFLMKENILIFNWQKVEISLKVINKGTISILSGGTLKQISEFQPLLQSNTLKKLSWFKYVPKENKLYVSYISGEFALYENVTHLNKTLV